MKRALLASAILVVFGLAACSSPAPSDGGAPAGAHDRSLAISDVQFGSGGQTILATDGVTWITADAGAAWQTLRVPGTLAGGHSVEVRGTTVAAATISSGELVYERSGDAGRTWTSQHLTVPQPTNTADVAVSGDGSTVALAALLPGTAGARGTAVLFVGASGRDLIARDVPIAGMPTWVGTHLAIAGGPLSSGLFMSDDQGKTWAQSTVAGVKAPSSSEVASDTPNIGTPVSSADGAIVPVTIHHGTGGSLSLLATTDGRTFNSVGDVPLTGEVGAGVTAIGSIAGPDSSVFADPTSTNLYFVTGSRVTTVPTSGLPGPAGSITFSDATHGLVSVSLVTCGSTKADCSRTVDLYQTSDGGRTWTRSAQPSA